MYLEGLLDEVVLSNTDETSSSSTTQENKIQNIFNVYDEKILKDSSVTQNKFISVFNHNNKIQQIL